MHTSSLPPKPAAAAWEAPCSTGTPVAKQASVEETLLTRRARTGQKITRDRSFMSNLLQKGRELMAVGDGVEKSFEVL